MTKASKKRNWSDLLLKSFLVLILLSVGFKLWLGQGDSSNSTDQLANSATINFANCLNQKGAMMYGVDNCEFCRNQKKMFGDQFDKIQYINCDFDRDLCQKKGIQYLPSWEIEGKIIIGLQNFESLASESGCVETL